MLLCHQPAHPIPLPAAAATPVSEDLVIDQIDYESTATSLKYALKQLLCHLNFKSDAIATCARVLMPLRAIIVMWTETPV